VSVDLLLVVHSYIITNMKPISLTVDEGEYETFRRLAASRKRSIAQLIRDAMTVYLGQLEQRSPLRDLPVLVGHHPIEPLPTRAEIYDDILASKASE
jgi:hypothetical protein